MNGTSPAAGADGHRRALDELSDAFAALVGDGRAAALVVRRGDEILLDLAAGDPSAADSRPFTSNTAVFLYSAVKPAAALTVLLAVADGALHLDVPVARYWPAFAAHGKGQVTVAESLAHGAAVPGWRGEVDLGFLADREAAGGALAQSEPWWRPGEPGEHAISYGHLLDGILTHATGRDIVWWWESLAASGVPIRLRPGTGEAAPWPLRDAEDAWQQRWRGAEGVMGELLATPRELLDADAVNGDAVRSLIAPAVTGYGSAHDLASLWTWWTGEAGGERLGTELRNASLAPVLAGTDHVLEQDVAWGLGPQIDDLSIGMGGVGGCFGLFLPRSGVSVGFTTADLRADDRVDVLDGPLARLARTPAPDPPVS